MAGANCNTICVSKPYELGPLPQPQFPNLVPTRDSRVNPAGSTNPPTHANPENSIQKAGCAKLRTCRRRRFRAHIALRIAFLSSRTTPKPTKADGQPLVDVPASTIFDPLPPTLGDPGIQAGFVPFSSLVMPEPPRLNTLKMRPRRSLLPPRLTTHPAPASVLRLRNTGAILLLPHRALPESDSQNEPNCRFRRCDGYSPCSPSGRNGRRHSRETATQPPAQHPVACSAPTATGDETLPIPDFFAGSPPLCARALALSLHSTKLAQNFA